MPLGHLLINPSDSSIQPTSLEFTPSQPELANSDADEGVPISPRLTISVPYSSRATMSLETHTDAAQTNRVPAPNHIDSGQNSRPVPHAELSRQSPFSERRLPLPSPFSSNLPSNAEATSTEYRGLPLRLQQSEPLVQLPPISRLPSLADIGIKPRKGGQGVPGGARSDVSALGQREAVFNQDRWDSGRGGANSFLHGQLERNSHERQTRVGWSEASYTSASHRDDPLVDVLGYRFDRNRPTEYGRSEVSQFSTNDDRSRPIQQEPPLRHNSRPFDGDSRLSASSDRRNSIDREQQPGEFSPRDPLNTTASASPTRVYPPTSDLLPSTLPLKRQRIDSLGRRAWTDEEDHLLKTAIMREGFGRWTEIAKSVPERTPDACRKRWEKVLDPSIRKGPWTPEEDELLTGLVERFGKRKWTQIASQIPGRTDKQCRQRWFDHLVAPMVRRSAVQLAAAAAASAAGGGLQHASPGDFGARREFGEDDRRFEMPPRSYTDIYPTQHGPPQLQPHSAQPSFYIPSPNTHQNSGSSSFGPCSDRPPPPTPSTHSYLYDGQNPRMGESDLNDFDDIYRQHRNKFAAGQNRQRWGTSGI
ncbi:hypothetical protein BJ742DRAFT_835275 [Cladochytrium replicatum]|nr:hypothetical protein BJ742DRAFT_835275 [Cladochytrium replicatum]